MNRGVRQLRIVGGSLRGRKLQFPGEPGLRPTPDRVRETLFNWLSPHIAGMRVLDLFAGSGALGIEALSRGAREVTLVDSAASACRQLRETREAWGLAALRVEQADGLAYLEQPGEPWDLILLDPPFAAGLLPAALRRISLHRRLAPGGFCYVELPHREEMPQIPAGWTLHRSGKAGEVGYHLLHEPRRDLSGNL